jgi:hypothetical protein
MRVSNLVLACFNKHAVSLGLVTALILASAPALAAKPAPPPPPPDPCQFPSVVTEASFPSFIFSRDITVKNGAYTIGTFLADASGKCQKKISESWPGAQEVNLRYDADTNLVLVVGDGLVARMTQVTFSPATGPAVPFLGPQVTLLTDAQIVTPAELASAGWTPFGTSDPRISPDGTQVLFQRSYLNQNGMPTWSLNTFWTCDLSYANSTIQPVDPSSCTEVHRAPVNDNDNYGSHASWGAKDATIYVTQPSTADVRELSLYRLTLPPNAPPNVVEIFSVNGAVFDKVRATATTDPAVSNGELVAVYDLGRPSNNWCSTVFVIDAYENCAGIGSCTILNNQGQGNGLRSVTWLPDGRVAGRGQTAPNRQGRCYSAGENASLGGTLDAFPAIDPYGTPATVLTTGGGYFEGAEGGW